MITPQTLVVFGFIGALVCIGVALAGVIWQSVEAQKETLLTSADPKSPEAASELELPPRIRGDELEAHYRIAGQIEESLVPVLKEADGTLKSVAANLQGRGAETTLGFLNDLRANAATAFDGLTKSFDQTQRYASLGELRQSYKVIRDNWWEGYNRSGSVFRDSLAAWLRWIWVSVTPPISPRLPA